MSEPIRVLHILQRMEAAGVQTLLMNLYRNIDREKIQFDFLVHYKERQFFDDEIEKLGGIIHRLSFREDYNCMKYYRDLNDFFSTHKEYKIIHGHMHSLGAIYFHVAQKYNVPIRIAHSHTNATQNDAKKYIKIFMNHMYKKDATHLFACSKDAGCYMFGNSAFRVINNAIITKNFVFSSDKRLQKRKELGVGNNIVLGNVGRFEIQKNHKFLLEIFECYHKKHPESVLLLIGTGSLLNNIRELVKKLNLDDSVKFLGNRRDVAELYQAMDVFVYPSLFEGLGIVVVEAQAAGTPVICTDTLPVEIHISPLLETVSLNDEVDTWVKKIEQAEVSRYAHQDMSLYIKKMGYDMDTVSKELQEFYLSL